MKYSWVVLGLAIGSVFAFGEVVDPLPDSSIWGAVLDFIRGLHGASLTMILAALIQLVMTVFRTSIGENIAGKYKLAALYGLSALAAIMDGVIAGHGLRDILLNAVVMGALMNSLNEIIKHLMEPKQQLKLVQP